MQHYLSEKLRPPSRRLGAALTVLLLNLGMQANCSEQAKAPPPPGKRAAINQVPGSQQPLVLIQVAAFASEENAKRLVSELSEADLVAFYTKDSMVKSERLFRVRVGPFPNEAHATAYLQKLQNSGFAEAYLIRQAEVPAQALSRVADDLGSRRAAAELAIRKITTSGDCSDPLWSPNGQEIAFLRNNDHTRGIYAIGTGGGHISRIMDSHDKIEVTGKFEWSPTAKRLAVVVRKIDPNWEPIEALWVIEKDGRKVTELLELRHSWQVFNDLWWSANAAFLAATVAGEESAMNSFAVYQIRVIPLAGDSEVSAINQKVRNEIEIDMPNLTSAAFGGDWRNEGTFLYFTTGKWENERSHKSNYQLWSYDVLSGENRVLWSTYDDLPIRGFALDQTKEYALLNKGAEIKLVDLYSLKEAGAVFADPGSKIDWFKMSGAREVYFVAGGELWRGNLDGRAVGLGIPIAGDFTLSPSGEKTCFVHDGDLVTVRLRE